MRCLCRCDERHHSEEGCTLCPCRVFRPGPTLADRRAEILGDAYVEGSDVHADNEASLRRIRGHIRRAR